MAEIRDADGLTIATATHKRTRPPLGTGFIACFRADLFAHVKRADTRQTCVISIAGLSKTPLSRLTRRRLTNISLHVLIAHVRLGCIHLDRIHLRCIHDHPIWRRNVGSGTCDTAISTAWIQ